jgi:hypothetical protein
MTLLDIPRETSDMPLIIMSVPEEQYEREKKLSLLNVQIFSLFTEALGLLLVLSDAQQLLPPLTAHSTDSTFDEGVALVIPFLPMPFIVT